MTSTDVTTSSTTAEVTTSGETTVATTTDTTGTTGTTTQDDESTSSTGGHGLCGWKPRSNYYACEKDGGMPGVEDPDHPIDCPPDVMKGDPCTEDGEINNYGCCTPEGVLYYCEITETQKVIEIDCGM